MVTTMMECDETDGGGGGGERGEEDEGGVWVCRMRNRRARTLKPQLASSRCTVTPGKRRDASLS